MARRDGGSPLRGVTQGFHGVKAVEAMGGWIFSLLCEVRNFILQNQNLFKKAYLT